MEGMIRAEHSCFQLILHFVVFSCSAPELESIKRFLENLIIVSQQQSVKPCQRSNALCRHLLGCDPQ